MRFNLFVPLYIDIILRGINTVYTIHSGSSKDLLDAISVLAVVSCTFDLPQICFDVYT